MREPEGWTFTESLSGAVVGHSKELGMTVEGDDYNEAVSAARKVTEFLKGPETELPDGAVLD